MSSLPLNSDNSDISVLVDGYNLFLKQGTGIKTYAATLVEVLSSLGVGVSVLSSKRTSGHTSLLREVSFFEDMEGAPRKLGFAKTCIKVLLGASSAGSKINRSFVEIDTSDFLHESEVNVFNSPYCYDVSNFLFSALKISSKLRQPPAHHFDVFHATYPLQIEIRGAKKITTIHDLIPLKLPYATLDNKRFFYQNVKRSIERSDAIATVSSCTKDDLMKVYDVPSEKIFVTYQTSRIKPLAEEERKTLQQGKILDQLGLKYQRYFLFVGAIEPKKNLKRLLTAYLSIDADFPLVIVGKKAWLWEDELRPLESCSDEQRERVILLDYVTVKTVRYLYAGSYCLVFPSLYEGFGLPVLEALTMGCPVITSKTSSLPEVGGNSALYVDPYSPESISSCMKDVLNDFSLRDQMSSEACKEASRFSREAYAERIRRMYETVLGTCG